MRGGLSAGLHRKLSLIKICVRTFEKRASSFASVFRWPLVRNIYFIVTLLRSRAQFVAQSSEASAV